MLPKEYRWSSDWMLTEIQGVEYIENDDRMLSLYSLTSFPNVSMYIDQDGKLVDVWMDEEEE